LNETPLNPNGVAAAPDVVKMATTASSTRSKFSSGALMPQSLSAVYIHLVFSTKNRVPWLTDRDLRERLYAELGGISKRLECAPILTGGVEDHVHHLVWFSRTISQAEWIKELKRASNKWLKEQDSRFSDFEWQAGYEPFDVGPSQAVHRQSRRASSTNDISGRASRAARTSPNGMG
jgi:putative transposase